MEPVVVDASIAVALLMKLPWSDAAERMFLTWHRQEMPLFAPALWPAEIVSALRKAVSVHQLDENDALLALALLPELGVQVYLPDAGLLESSLRWAGRLGQRVAYDAQYLSLAERLGALFWTADRKLFQRCAEIGVEFVRLLAPYGTTGIPHLGI